MVVQGFGNVGGTAARLFHEAGAKVIAAQDHTGTVHNAAGLDVHKLLSHVSQHGGVGGFTGGQAMDKNEFWTLETEFLIPAALESQITAANAAKVRAKIVVEGANGPTTPEADDILFEHGVYVVPDVLANAGGVTVSYFEWVQDFSSFFWSEDEINQRLERIMREAYAGISQVAREHKVTLRTAAFIVACTRIPASPSGARPVSVIPNWRDAVRPAGEQEEIRRSPRKGRSSFGRPARLRRPSAGAASGLRPARRPAGAIRTPAAARA